MEFVYYGCHHETGETNSTHLRVASGTRRFLSRVSSASCDGSFTSSQTRRIPLQLLIGHEPAPIEGEAFDDEEQNRSVTVSMAARLARQQSAMKAWLQAKAESRVERAQNRRTHVVQHWSSGTRVYFWRADVPSMVSLPTIRQGSTAIVNKHTGAWLGLASVLAQEMGRSQEQHEEAHGTVWIVVQGGLLRCAPEHLRHLSANVKVCRSTETKETRTKLERSLTLFRISVSRKVHTLIFEVSLILLMGPSHDTSAERFL